MTFHLTDYSIVCEMDWLVKELSRQPHEIQFRGVPFKLSKCEEGMGKLLFGLDSILTLECGRWDKHVVSQGTASYLLGCLVQAIQDIPLFVLYGDDGNMALGTDGLTRYDWNPCSVFPSNAVFQPVIRETVMTASDAFKSWLNDIGEDRGWFPWATQFHSVRIREEFGHLHIRVTEHEKRLPPCDQEPALPEALLCYSRVWERVMQQLHQGWTDGSISLQLPSKDSLVKEQLSLLHWLLRHYTEPIKSEQGIPQMVKTLIHK